MRCRISVRAQTFLHQYKVYPINRILWTTCCSHFVFRHRDNSLVHSSMKRWWSHSGAEEVDLRASTSAGQMLEQRVHEHGVTVTCSTDTRVLRIITKSHDDVSVQWELEPVRNWLCQTVLILKSQRTETGLKRKWHHHVETRVSTK